MKVDIIDCDKNKCIVLLERHRFQYLNILRNIPRGYLSDGASVPRALWRLLSPPIDRQTLRASVEHDWIYENKIGTREAADRHYCSRLILDGYPVWKAVITYYGLRLFGRFHWGER